NSRRILRWYLSTSRSNAFLSPRCTRATNSASTSRSLMTPPARVTPAGAEQPQPAGKADARLLQRCAAARLKRDSAHEARQRTHRPAGADSASTDRDGYL